MLLYVLGRLTDRKRPNFDTFADYEVNFNRKSVRNLAARSVLYQLHVNNWIAKEDVDAYIEQARNGN